VETVSAAKALEKQTFAARLTSAQQLPTRTTGDIETEIELFGEIDGAVEAFARSRNACEKQQAVALCRRQTIVVYRKAIVDEGLAPMLAGMIGADKTPVRNRHGLIRHKAALRIQRWKWHFNGPAVRVDDLRVARNGRPAFGIGRSVPDFEERMAGARTGDHHDMVAETNHLRCQPFDLTLNPTVTPAGYYALQNERHPH